MNDIPVEILREIFFFLDSLIYRRICKGWSLIINGRSNEGLNGRLNGKYRNKCRIPTKRFGYCKEHIIY